jgi:hypothetical protein
MVKTDLAERYQCKPVILILSLAGIWKNHLCLSMGPIGGSVALDLVSSTKQHGAAFVDQDKLNSDPEPVQ